MMVSAVVYRKRQGAQRESYGFDIPKRPVGLHDELAVGGYHFEVWLGAGSPTVEMEYNTICNVLGCR